MLITLSGPSGAGKTTLIKELVKENLVSPLKSYSTREPRGAAEDLYYYFKSEDEYKEMSCKGEFVLEDFVSNKWYGTKKSDLNEAIRNDSIWIADFTVQSVIDLVMQGVLPKLSVFLFVERSTSIARMRLRGDSEEKIITRQRQYDIEMENIVRISTIFNNVNFMSAEKSEIELLHEFKILLGKI